MAPYIVQDEVILEEHDASLPKLVAPQADITWKPTISWINVVLFGYYHLAALYGLYSCFTSAHWATIFLAAVLSQASMLGVVCGTHRLWSHKSYKAKLPLQIILVVLQTLSGQYSVYNWVRDHRIHHRYSDTDADPHNATRGFFFSHIGWLLIQKHPEVHKRGKSTDMSDITNNPVLAFQKKYWGILYLLICCLIPTAIPMYFWGETLLNAWNVNMLRFTLCLNLSSLVNSAAHAFGSRPYDKNLQGRQNMIATYLTLGEGFHNYHHAFPWDYAAGELGEWSNFSKTFIDFFARIGWAYDLKTIENKSVIKRVIRTGDGSYSWKTEDKALIDGNKPATISS